MSTAATSPIETSDSESESDDLLEPFVDLWARYRNPTLALSLGFEVSNDASNTTFMPAERVISTSLCPDCGGSVELILQLNLGDKCFWQNEDKSAYSAEYCPECNRFIVTQLKHPQPPPPDHIAITQVVPISDGDGSLITVPHRSEENGDTFLSETKLDIYPGSKIGGTRIKCRRRKFSTRVDFNCRCYLDPLAQLVIVIKNQDNPHFGSLELSEVMVTQCAGCSSLHWAFYSQDLDLPPYNTHMFSYENIYYHVVQSEDDLNGVILQTSAYSSTILASCQVTDFLLKEGKYSFSRIDTLTRRFQTRLSKLGVGITKKDILDTKRVFSYLR